PPRDRDRATRRHGPPCRQGPRTFDADLARVGTVGRTRRGRGRDSRAGLARHPLPVGERDLGRGARTAAYHAHDLDSVPIAECDARERSARDDLAVVLHRDRARVDAQPLEVVEQGGWLIELYLLAVSLQGAHSTSLM